MPKIIENVREQLLCEAKRQIEQNGYAKTTIRSVASACGLGVGTVYNYFKSKDMLIASFMAEEWKEMLCKIDRNGNAEDLLRSVFSVLTDFSKKHSALFCDSDAEKVFATAFSEWHPVLRRQIAEILLPFCKGEEFSAEFISESLLTWTMAGKDFETQYSVIKKLL